MNKHEDKQKVLDTVNQWIFNCDTKVSIILAMLGVFLTVLLSSDIGKCIFNIVKISLYERTICSILYFVLLITGIIILVLGIYKLIRVLIPTINLKHKSVMFFGNVASYSSFIEYCDAVKNTNNDEIAEDLLHQIYAASKICSIKFKNQKIGIFLSSIGLVIILAWLVFGIIVYYI